MKLSISNIAFEAARDDEVYNLLKKHSFDGVEIAPTRLFENPYEDLSRIASYSEMLCKKYSLEISSMQSIWFGRGESIYDAEGRHSLIEYTKKAIDFAAAGGIDNLVFGCPKNRNIPPQLNQNDAYDIACEFLATLGEYALAQGTALSLEPNPDIYGTNFINTTCEAFDLVRQIGCDGLRVNVDVGTMLHHSEQAEMLVDNIELINHIHLSLPYLEYVTPNEFHSRLREILRLTEYDRYLSIEMKKVDEFDSVVECIKYVGDFFKA